MDILQDKKSLLAFSYGADSTALFHILVSKNIQFDCCFVNYKTRPQSDIEEQNAQILCDEFKKQLYIKISPLNLTNSSNFESVARNIRYSFFDEICVKFNYEILIFAHQLNDCLEWLLMQLSKGSGAALLVGMEEKNNRISKFGDKKKEILVFRPLINVSKIKILKYLEVNNLRYFEDSSNLNLNFKRNYIRTKFSNNFINDFESGVKKSMEFLRADKHELLGNFNYINGEFFIIKKSSKSINLIDQACKKLHVVISQKTRKELLKSDCVVSHKIAIVSNENFYFVAPFIKKKLEKRFKEKCRILKIPPLIRSYLSLNPHLLSVFEKYKP